MIVYDEFGNSITLEISDDSAVLDALTAQNETLTEQNELLQTVVDNQAQILTAQNDLITVQREMLQYTAYIFVIVLGFSLIKLFSSALSSMFGGG